MIQTYELTILHKFGMNLWSMLLTVKMFIMIKSRIDFIRLKFLILMQLMEGLKMDFLQSSLTNQNQEEN
jgi:hypothetical protein